MASWNVCGCRKKEKRQQIDTYLHSYGVAVAFLQEANIDAARSNTTNYTWLTGTMRTNQKRNLAVLTSRWFDIRHVEVLPVGRHALQVNLRYAVSLRLHCITVLNVHGPNRHQPPFLAHLGSFLNSVPNIKKTLLVGDFNCQLAWDDATESEKFSLGPVTCHQTTNENGVQFRYFLNRHKLVVLTMRSHRSLLWTWTNGTTCSQLDHVILPSKSQLFLKHTKASKPSAVKTDHKLVLWEVIQHSVEAQQRPIQKKVAFRVRSPLPASEASCLRQPEIMKQYHDRLQKIRPVSMSSTVDDAWEEIIQKTKKAASSSLRKTSFLPRDRECRLAAAAVSKYRFWMSWKPSERVAAKLEESTARLKVLLKKCDEEKCVEFFKEKRKLPLGKRIHQTCRFMKNDLKATKRIKYSTIPINAWQTPAASQEDGLPKPIDERDGQDLPAGPTLADLQRILTKTHNGKAAGHDRLPAEYFKYADEPTLRELHAITKEVWDNNKLPSAWKKNIVVPIPKIRNPSTVDHYRKICLSSTGYKLYATWVLEVLQRYVGEIGPHQAAFSEGRSTTDHLFVAQRVLQEHWNGGDPLYLMSLDIEKAFDRINLQALPAVILILRMKDEKLFK